MTVEIICECNKKHNVTIASVPCAITFICDECKISRIIPILTK